MTLPPALCGPLALPVVASPLFIVSGPQLVAAQCAAGVIGSFPALNARPASLLRDWLAELTEGLESSRAQGNTPAPFAVNQIVHRSNDRLEEDLQACVDYEVPIVITSLGAREEVNEAVHSYGGIVLHDVINNRFAHKAIEKGADGLIAVAAGAGGHAGTTSPFALLREIREWFTGPLLLSGAIADGRSILAAQIAGADMAYVGSAFMATEEANAVPAYKQMLVDGSSADIVYSSHFTGVPGNYLRASIEAAGLNPDNLEGSDPSSMNFGSGRTKAWKDIWGAGQGIGSIKEVTTVSAVVERLAAEYRAARQTPVWTGEALASLPV